MGWQNLYAVSAMAWLVKPTGVVVPQEEIPSLLDKTGKTWLVALGAYPVLATTCTVQLTGNLTLTRAQLASYL